MQKRHIFFPADGMFYERSDAAAGHAIDIFSDDWLRCCRHAATPTRPTASCRAFHYVTLLLLVPPGRWRQLSPPMPADVAMLPPFCRRRHAFTPFLLPRLFIIYCEISFSRAFLMPSIPRRLRAATRYDVHDMIFLHIIRFKAQIKMFSFTAYKIDRLHCFAALRPGPPFELSLRRRVSRVYVI